MGLYEIVPDEMVNEGPVWKNNATGMYLFRNKNSWLCLASETDPDNCPVYSKDPHLSVEDKHRKWWYQYENDGIEGSKIDPTMKNTIIGKIT